MNAKPRSFDYYSSVGSYDGAIKIGRKWVRAVELNRIDKTGWNRRQGPMNAAIAKAIKSQPPMQAVELFPGLAK